MDGPSSTARSPWAAGGPHVLQAAIASWHAESPCDWAQIAALYAELARLTGSPVVELNRAIAIAETNGAEAGLQIVDGLGLDDFRYLHSTRAELLRRLGRTDEARRLSTGEGAHRRRSRTALPRTPAHRAGRHNKLGLVVFPSRQNDRPPKSASDCALQTKPDALPYPLVSAEVWSAYPRGSNLRTQYLNRAKTKSNPDAELTR